MKIRIKKTGKIVEAECMVVIGSKVCYEVAAYTEGSFYHCGAWYITERECG